MKKGRHRLIAAVLLTALLGVLHIAGGAAEADFFSVMAHIPVRQTFSTNVSNADNLFTYVLEARTQGAPMPGSGARYTFELKGNVSKDIAMEVRSPGTYTYRLYQTIEKARPHYRYDRTVYEVTVYAYRDGSNRPSVSVVMHGQGDGKVSSAIFRNRYSKSSPTSPPGDGGSVQTGDENQLVGYIVMMVACALGLCLLWVWVKKKDKP